MASLNGHITTIDIQVAIVQKSKAKAQKLHIINIDFILDYQRYQSVIILIKNEGYQETKYTRNWLA